jgi:hypothetical protein
MPNDNRPKKKRGHRKTKRGVRTKISLVPEDDISSEEENSSDEEVDEGGMFLEKEDVKLIYNALSAYKPNDKEEHLHSVLLEEFEEILVVDYNEPYPEANNSKFTG